MTQYYDDTAREYAERAEAAAASAHQSKQQASTAATTATTQANIAVNAAANATTLVKSDLEAAVGQMKQDALSAATQSSDAASAASGSAVTASQAAIDAREWATRASASAVAAAGSTTMANQAAAEAHDWAVQAMNYIPLELQAPPTQSTVATLGRLALWHDETAGVYHAYHLVGITEGDNPAYQWEECVLESMLGVPDGVATLDANGKVPASQLPSGQGAEPVILDAPPTAATEGTLGQLGLWRDATNNTDHVYVLVFTSTSAGATMYHWDECVLESARNVPDGFAGLDANGKVAPAQLPVPAGNNIGAVKANTAQGTQVDNSGYLTLTQASINEINTRATNRKPIIPSTLNHAVTAAITDENHITLDADQQATAQTVFNVPDVDATGASLGLSIDPSTYVMTLALKNAAGDTLDTKTVDLPLETMVVSASYANGILTLTLQSGATTDIDISALVDGLIPASEKGAVNGVATLGNDGKVPSAQLPTIPTALSQLTADSTHRTVTDAEKQTWNAKSDFSGSYNDLTNKPTIPSKTSDLTNDSGFQTASDVAAAISGKADASALTAHTGNTTIHVTAADKTAWNAKSDFSGSYNDLTNKPDIPDSAEDVGAIPATEKGANNGVATLGNDGKVPDTQLPDFGLPLLSGTTNPTYGTAAEPGQCYVNTTDGTLFYCARIETESSFYPDGMYYWNKVHAGEHVVIPKTLFLGAADQYTYGNETFSTLAAGISITQWNHAHWDIAFGQNIYQDGTYSLALGEGIRQEMASGHIVSVGTNITANMAGPALAVGDHITQSFQIHSMAVGEYISQLYSNCAIAVGSHITTDRLACIGAAYFGSYNAPVANDSPMRVTGNGTAENARKNIEELTGGGDLYITGGYRQGITVIPVATTEYTLKEGVFTHAPEATTTYTLPAVTDATRTHRIELTVDFTTVQTYAFVDSESTAVTPVFSPTIEAGNIYTFKMEYSSVLDKWLIYPEKHGEEQYIELSQKGANNGVATLGNDGKVPSTQLPPISSVPDPITALVDPTNTTVGVLGQLYLNTYADKAFVCAGSYNAGTAQAPSLRYGWMPIVAGSGGTVWKNVIISQLNNNTVDTASKPVLIVGNSNTQSQALASTIVGHDITQNVCNQSAAVGQHITQNGCGDSLAIGLYISQRVCEAVLMSGLYLTSDSGVPEGASYFGKYNAPSSGNMRVTGGGTADNARKNIEELSASGDLYIAGGYRQGIIVIPAATAAYTLSEGMFTHAPEAAPTYTLPDVTDTTRTHRIELTVDFTTVQTCSFVDSESAAVTPVYEPPIAAGDVCTFKMEYSSVLNKWLIYTEKQGSITYIPKSYIGVGGGVAGLDANGRLPNSQLADGVVVNRYVFVGDPTTLTLPNPSAGYNVLAAGQNMTFGSFSARIVACGDTLSLTGTNSLAVGYKIYQRNVNDTAAIGYQIEQNGPLNTSLAVGEGLVQNKGFSVFATGLYLTTDSNAAGTAYFGRFNAPSSGNIRVTGCGTEENARKNIEELSEAGDLYITGGYRQGITVIPAATAAYTLAEGVFTHAPASSPTYTLPAVTDTTRTHRIELTVDFTTVQTYAFVDSASAAVTPVSAPTIAAGDIITFKMEYSSVLDKWLVYAEKHGEEQYVALSQKGVANGVATLGSDGKVPAAQLPPSSGVPAALHGNADPTINTVGVPGQLYFNDTAGTVFACCVVNTVDTDVYQYVWAPVVANAGGYVGYYLLVGAPNTYTKTAQTQYVLAAGSTLNQSDAGSSLAVGSNISQAPGSGVYVRQRTTSSMAVGYGVTQASTYGAGAVGVQITQTGGVQNFAAGNGLTQNGSYYCTALGHNNSQGDSCLDSLVNGLYVTQTNGEGVLMSGIYLTNTAYKSGGSYFGLFNAENANAIRITGYGADANNRKNIEELSTSGDLYITGGHQQQITTIPTATTAYTLAEGVYVHVPATVATYTLPTPTDITRTHEIIIDVEFSADTSVTFQDSSSVEIEPLSEPETEAGTVVSYLCRFSLLLYRWVIMPVVQGVAGA